MKIAVVFPGIGYHVDKPLLYYSKKIAASCGYEIKNVPYGGFPPDIKGDQEKMEEGFHSALAQTEEILSDVDFSKYEEILFLSKSIGTAIAAAYGRKHGLKTNNVYFTPVPETFQFVDQPGIVFHGTADGWMDDDLCTRECGEHGLPLYVTQGANHSMETGDWKRDLEILGGIMETVAEYLGALDEVEPQEVIATVKLDVVMEAIELADDAFTYYLDTQTGESIMLNEYERDQEVCDRIEYAEPGRYLMLPMKYDIHEYSIMERFVWDLPDGREQDELARAIRGKGAFRRFKDKLFRFGIEKQWYDYRDAAYRKIALEWCADHGIRAVE